MVKSKWEDIKDKLTLIEGWARDGLTDEASNLRIGRTTLNEKRRKTLKQFSR